MSFAPPQVQLPPGFAREVEPLWHIVVRAFFGFLAEFGEPAAIARRNDPCGLLVRGAIRSLTRLQRIVRCLFIVYAGRLLKLEPALRAAATNKPELPRPGPRDVDLRPAPAPSGWRVAPALLRRTRPLLDSPPPAPPQRSGANPLRLLARKLEGLRRMLARADFHVRRLARLIARFFVWVRVRKRALRGRFGVELQDARKAARWALHWSNTS